MTFEFATAGRVRFGEGARHSVPAEAAAMGRRVLLVHGASADRAAWLHRALLEQGAAVVAISISGEPTVSVVSAGAATARSAGCDVVVALGGGSVLDAGKALGALIPNPGDPLRYLEVVGEGRPLEQHPLPVIALPTTAGTGSEVTRNAVLGVPEQHVKVSLRDVRMLPALAVVDPELTYDLPPAQTAATGLDALTQLIEPFTCRAPNPFVDALCREGIPRAARALARIASTGADAEARRDLAFAALLSGMALANAKLGAVHGFAAPIGGRFPAPHGMVCARLLPQVMEANIRALEARDPGHPALARFAEVARLLTGRPEATAPEGVAFVAGLVRDLGVPPLRTWGVDRAHADELVQAARRASSMQGNPVTLTDAELLDVLSLAI